MLVPPWGSFQWFSGHPVRRPRPGTYTSFFNLVSRGRDVEFLLEGLSGEVRVRQGEDPDGDAIA